jgi:hypothetical protein
LLLVSVYRETETPALLLPKAEVCTLRSTRMAWKEVDNIKKLKKAKRIAGIPVMNRPLQHVNAPVGY